ncbi:hypothetical protein DB346_09930 [Verrucomicrobia bacterium LW23]|nr:hypothetical protein DB346_09930 [Verrucomicrobia bacterium LW23]
MDPLRKDFWIRDAKATEEDAPLRGPYDFVFLKTLAGINVIDDSTWVYEESAHDWFAWADIKVRPIDEPAPAAAEPAAPSPSPAAAPATLRRGSSAPEEVLPAQVAPATKTKAQGDLQAQIAAAKAALAGAVTPSPAAGGKAAAPMPQPAGPAAVPAPGLAPGASAIAKTPAISPVRASSFDTPSAPPKKSPPEAPAPAPSEADVLAAVAAAKAAKAKAAEEAAAAQRKKAEEDAAKRGPALPQKDWYLMQFGEQVGPVSTAELVERLNLGKVPRDTQVWCDGMAEWAAAQDVETLAKNLKAPEPPAPAPVADAPPLSAAPRHRPPTPEEIAAAKAEREQALLTELKRSEKLPVRKQPKSLVYILTRLVFGLLILGGLAYLQYKYEIFTNAIAAVVDAMSLAWKQFQDIFKGMKFF